MFLKSLSSFRNVRAYTIDLVERRYERAQADVGGPQADVGDPPADVGDPPADVGDPPADVGDPQAFRVLLGSRCIWWSSLTLTVDLVGSSHFGESHTDKAIRHCSDHSKYPDGRVGPNWEVELVLLQSRIHQRGPRLGRTGILPTQRTPFVLVVHGDDDVYAGSVNCMGLIGWS